MKIIIVVLIALCYSLTAPAQQSGLFKAKPWEDLKLKNKLSDSLKYVRPLPNLLKGFPAKEDPGVMKLDLKGTFLAKNPNGDEIYAMQPDNMPCLVPDKKLAYNMPVAGFEKGNASLISPFKSNNTPGLPRMGSKEK